MDTSGPDSDHEALLQQSSKQVETLKLSEEEKNQASDTYKEIIKKTCSQRKAYNEIKRRGSKSYAILTEEIAKLMRYNQMNEGHVTKLRKMQQEKSAKKNGAESMLFNELHQLSTQYENLQFEFEDKSLQAMVTRMKETTEPLIEERHQYRAILKPVTEESFKSEPTQEYYHTTPLLSLSESIKQEKPEAFGFSHNSKEVSTKLIKKMQNIAALKKQVINLKKQISH